LRLRPVTRGESQASKIRNDAQPPGVSLRSLSLVILSELGSYMLPSVMYRSFGQTLLGSHSSIALLLVWGRDAELCPILADRPSQGRAGSHILMVRTNDGALKLYGCYSHDQFDACLFCRKSDQPRLWLLLDNFCPAGIQGSAILQS
jgi:hypothetical protein